MDEGEFRHVANAVRADGCEFSRAIMAGYASCSRTVRMQIGERELLVCNHAQHQARCADLHAQLRRSFSFALGQVAQVGALTHAQEMRIQCGGLMGLQQVICGDAIPPDVDALLERALLDGNDLASLPYSAIVHEASLLYRGRHA